MKRIIVPAILVLFVAMGLVIGRNTHDDSSSTRWDYLVNDIFNGTKYYQFRLNSFIIFNKNGTCYLESQSLGASMTSCGFVHCNGTWQIIDDTLRIDKICSDENYRHTEYKDYRYWQTEEMLYLSPVTWPELKTMTFSEFMVLRNRPEGGILYGKNR